MSTGLWNDPTVPKRGWICVDINDLGAPQKICEMCCVQEIRYVHTMQHTAYASLEVGCVCAGHMEGSLDAARTREAGLKNRIERERRAKERAIEYERRVKEEAAAYSTRTRQLLAWRGWRISRSGNLWRMLDECRLVVIHEPPRGWFARGYLDLPDGTSGQVRTPQHYATEHEAKLAAIDLTEKLNIWKRKTWK
jgi:hypothetical protein